MTDSSALPSDRAFAPSASSQPEAVSPVPASIPSAEDRDAILLEVAGWVEESDLRDLQGVWAKRKRDREDAALRLETSKAVRSRLASMIRGRMENKVGDALEFLSDVKAGRYERMLTGHTLREAIALANKGLLKVTVETQIAGPWNNTIGGNTEYHIQVTEKGEVVLASAIEARRAETQGGSVHESAVTEGQTP